jgi:hypothetical protein
LVAAGVALLAAAGQLPSSRTLEAFTATAAADWTASSDALLVGAGEAFACLQQQPEGGWLQGWAAEVQHRCVQ